MWAWESACLRIPITDTRILTDITVMAIRTPITVTAILTPMLTATPITATHMGTWDGAAIGAAASMAATAVVMDIVAATAAIVAEPVGSVAAVADFVVAAADVGKWLEATTRPAHTGRAGKAAIPALWQRVAASKDL